MPDKIGCSFTTSIEDVLNVDAYRPGDFRQFFNDPRTRQQYLKWAWMLLEAEEYHAGNRPVPESVTKPPRRKTSEGSYKYQKRKRQKALVGQAVRLKSDLHTNGGEVYEKGSLWRVTHLYRGKFNIDGITLDGQSENHDKVYGERRYVFGVSEYFFEPAPEIPAAPRRKK